MKPRKDTAVKAPRDMSFEDTVRRVLKAGPMPKCKTKPEGKKTQKTTKRLPKGPQAE
jgi:hypothetical protein